ncbi:hypothetical protein H0G86_004268 [Trichoderma simmonsii]|uniref:Secreted protein n=1 Tax=Trichoderma simmonsii TaxID=1491479 RepID=A0A8G0L9B4_9HYPO|nr:hypothetical protein H0G86_004268 [Trichoderma simmonsii]
MSRPWWLRPRFIRHSSLIHLFLGAFYSPSHQPCVGLELGIRASVLAASRKHTHIHSHTHLFLRRRRVQYQDKAGTCCAKLTHLHKRIRVTIFPSPRCGLFSQVETRNTDNSDWLLATKLELKGPVFLLVPVIRFSHPSFCGTFLS